MTWRTVVGCRGGDVIALKANDCDEVISCLSRHNEILSLIFPGGFSPLSQRADYCGINPRLLQYILIPFLINLVVFSGAVYLGLDFFGEYGC